MYICPRCGFHEESKNNMKVHLLQKTICEPLLTNDDLEGYKNMIFEIQWKQSICLLCDREYTSRFGWSKHMKQCPKFKYL